MFRYKRVMQVCFAVFFGCIAIYVTYAAFHQLYIGLAAGLGVALAAIPFVLNFFSRFRHIMPFIFCLCFVADCMMLSFMTGTPVYMPLIFICGSVAVSFFVNPMVNAWYAALSNVAILVSIFILKDTIEQSVPITVFCMLFALYDFAQVTVIALIYAVRRNTGVLARRLKKTLLENRRKNLFWETTAKEIGKPLGEITNLCQGLLRSDINDIAREKTYAIQSAARNLQVMLSDAGDYTRIENKSLKIQNEPYIFGSLINDIVNFCSVRLNNDDVSFIVDCDPDIPAELVGDRSRIAQVVLCLFSNALLFTRHGSITLKVSSRLSGGGINLRISVSDTGVGIAPEAMDKIFTVYSGINANGKYYATHLGLGNAKELVTLMGGFIFAESTPGSGSTFTVTIPQQVNSALPFAQAENKEKLHVLIYPEDVSAKEALEKQCAQLGIKMDFCASHKEFMLKKENPDITHLFTDYSFYCFDKPIFDMLSQRMQIIVTEAHGKKKEELPPNIKRIFKPLYSAALVSVFNNNMTFTDDNSYMIAFTAPKANILIVDDSPVNLKVLGAFLQPYDMTVFSADNGEDAIKIVKSHHIDLVLMDHIMPAPDGIETTRKIRAHKDPYFRNIPIIACTANTQPEMKRLFLENGLDDFLCKPIEFSALNAMLKKWLTPDLVVHCRKPKEIPVPSLPEKSYDGLNPRQGILNIGGNVEAYTEVLETFMNDYTHAKDALNDAIYTRNFARYAIQVHAVKGASANIGAAQLSELARQLEIAAKSNEAELVIDRTPVLLKLYEDVNSQILSYFADNGIKVKKQADFAAVLPAIRLEIEESNAADSAKMLEELLECILTEQQREIVQLTLGAVNNFDFEDAAKQLTRLEGASL